jgi:hypothetical protein
MRCNLSATESSRFGRRKSPLFDLCVFQATVVLQLGSSIATMLAEKTYLRQTRGGRERARGTLVEAVFRREIVIYENNSSVESAFELRRDYGVLA